MKNIISQKEINFNPTELEEWLEEADALARQTNIAFGFRRVKNWDDARREALRLTTFPEPDLAEAGRELLAMIPTD